MPPPPLPSHHQDRSGCCVQLALLVGRKLWLTQLGSGGALLCEGDQGGFSAFEADMEMEEERIQQLGHSLDGPKRRKNMGGIWGNIIQKISENMH